MANKNFLLLSMEDDKIKKISNVISNDSCRRILDYLSIKEATESELSEKLEIPISTVHYNLQQLMETGLITAEEFHYSRKGKEVNHYRLANKYIIIAPKKTFGIKQKLRSILPVALIAAGAAGVIQLYNTYFSNFSETHSQSLMAAKSFAEGVASDNAQSALSTAAPMTNQAIQTSIPNLAIWFLFGALFAILIYLILSYYKREID